MSMSLVVTWSIEDIMVIGSVWVRRHESTSMHQIWGLEMIGFGLEGNFLDGKKISI
jgi:lipoprotein signal peptidase